MRFRSVVLPTAVALAAVVAVPSSADAAVQCGLITPTKVVIDAPYVGAPMKLTTGCYVNDADHASWTLEHETGWGDTIAFPDVAGGDAFYLHPFVGDKDMGRFLLKPVEAEKADGTSLTQNSATILVKYASRLAAPVTRTSTGLRWAATASQWDTFWNDFRVRPGVTVGLFHQTSSSAAWTYVKSAKTSSTGKVTISLAAPKSGNYRLVVGETPDTWAAYSRTVKGRV
jgi:hypothetical protein